MKNFTVINEEELKMIKGGIFSETLGTDWSWDDIANPTPGGVATIFSETLGVGWDWDGE